MRGLMKLAGVARFDCIGSTQEFACYMAGLASPGDHTCGWTTSTLHSHLAWRYWFRWGCGASSTTSVIADLAGSHIPYPRSTGPDHAAMHPLRRDTPDPSRCTRSEGVQCLRIGCTASHNKHKCEHSLQTYPTDSIGRRHTASTCSPRLRTRNAAPVRECYPPSSWCNTPLSGVTPLSNKYRCGDMPRLSSQNTRQRSSAATEETVHHRETGAGNEATDSSTHQLLGHSNTRTTCACQRLRSLCGDNHAISSLLRHTSSHGR